MTAVQCVEFGVPAIHFQCLVVLDNFDCESFLAAKVVVKRTAGDFTGIQNHAETGAMEAVQLEQRVPPFKQ